jgi:outer membrane protein assembly factor BamA
MVLGSVEYIYPIWEKINAYFFLDAGTVSNNIVDEFDVDNLKYGYGTGFLFWNAEEVITDFSVAHSRDGFRFYLELNVSL